MKDNTTFDTENVPHNVKELVRIARDVRSDKNAMGWIEEHSDGMAGQYYKKFLWEVAHPDFVNKFTDEAGNIEKEYILFKEYIETYIPPVEFVKITKRGMPEDLERKHAVKTETASDGSLIPDNEIIDVYKDISTDILKKLVSGMEVIDIARYILSDRTTTLYTKQLQYMLLMGIAATAKAYEQTRRNG